jgi:UDP-glucose 4-epimerase
MENKILVLGASGFIGKFLSKNLEAIPVSRKDVDLEDFNEVRSLLKIHKPDVIINCASNTDTKMMFNAKAYHQNLVMFNNLYLLREEFGKLINFGSGAEFDRRFHINNLKEESIFACSPFDHYGMSKNIISRMMFPIDNFYNLRLFGCFHDTENNSKLFKKILTKEPIKIDNKYFDYISLDDVLTVVENYIDKECFYKDLNLVYTTKLLLSEVVDEFIKIHNLPNKVIIKNVGLNYTGNGSRLSSLKLNLKGMNQGLIDYKI